MCVPVLVLLLLLLLLQAVVSQLLAAGADPNKTNSTGSNPLLEAALLCKDDILNLLLQAGKEHN